MATVSHEDILRVAKLANLELTADDVDRYAHDLAQILGYVDRLQRVDASQVEEGAAFQEALPPDRDMVRTDPEIRERIIQEFPDRLGDLLRVPGVFAHRKS